MNPSRLRQRFEAILARSGPDPPLSLGGALGVLSAVYGGAMALRSDLYRWGVIRSRKLPCPVVSVGNLTVGGTGKTPMIAFLAGRLRASGLRPAVVSRGYGGSMERCGAIVSDGRRLLLPPDAAGDEPWMLARRLPEVPVVVGQDRYRAGRLANDAFSPDLVLLDDGFQHLRLRRDLNLLLLDGAAPLGNGRIFPRGILREPPGAAARADAVIFTRFCAGVAPDADTLRWVARGLPCFRAVHIPRLRWILAPGKTPADAEAKPGHDAIAGLRVFAFSGIAGNEAFFSSIRQLGGRTAACRGFPDHHRYRRQERTALEKAATRAGADLMATTEKDFARLGGANPFGQPLAVLGVDLDLVSGKEKLARLLARCVGAPRGH